MSRILIAGCNGQLGSDCRQVLKKHDVLGVDLPEINITSASSVGELVRRFNPGFLVNCAAYTAVDKAETDQTLCSAVNAAGPAVLADVCRENNVFLVHVSTDYVFNGRRPVPEAWTESDTPDPTTVYGVTKLAGEQAIIASKCRYAILRTAWLYGAHGKNFPKTMLRLALADPKRTIRVVDDQFGCPTWSLRLAGQIQAIIESPAPPVGLFHAVAQGHTSWYGFASEFLRLMDVPHVIEPCTTADYPTPAKRPLNSILEDAALKSIGLCRMDGWKDALEEFVRENHAALLAEF